jgi:hypothetical protein
MTGRHVRALYLTQYYITIQGKTFIRAFTDRRCSPLSVPGPRCTLPLLVLLPQTIDFVSG